MAPKETPLALSLLSRAHSPDTALKIYTERILHRPLHLASNDKSLTSQQTRRLKRVCKKLLHTKKPGRPKPLSSREARALDIYSIPKSAKKYSIYAPLHQLWIGYIQEVLWEDKGFSPVNNLQAAKLCTADFHGAELEVVRSRCVSRVGIKGIVVKDSRSIFELITSEDQVKIVPKEGTVFRFQLPIPEMLPKCDNTETKTKIFAGVNAADSKAEGSEHDKEEVMEKKLVFELHGDQFLFRATDRANRKFKPHFLPYL